MIGFSIDSSPSVAYCMASSLPFPDVAFLSPHPRNSHRLYLSLSRLPLSAFRVKYGLPIGNRTRTQTQTLPVKEDTAVAMEEREAELLKQVNRNRAASSYGVNGSSNGSYAGNGSLVNYVNANGSGNGAVSAGRVLIEEEVAEDGRKRRIEEIGKEEA